MRNAGGSSVVSDLTASRVRNAFPTLHVCLALAWLWLAGGLASSGEPEEATATVRGKAMALTGRPVAGVRVTVVHRAPEGAEREWSATTAADGRFALTVPVSGYVSLSPRVEPPPGGTLAPCSVEPRQMLRVQAGDTAELTVLLAPATARLGAIVTDSEGRPVEGARVVVSMSGVPGAIERSAASDAKGRCRLAGLAPGAYVVRSVEPPEGSCLIRLHTWRPHGVRQVSIGDGQTAREDFQLPRGTRFAGRVLGEQGKPLAGAAVTCRLDVATEVGQPRVYQQVGQWYRGTAVTDASGRYSLGGLTLETYQIEVQPPEGRDLAPAVVHNVNASKDGGDVAVQDIRLYAGAALAGTVVGADGKPVEGAAASIRVGWGRHGTMLAAESDARGSFTLRGLPSGAYTVTVRPPAGVPWCERAFERVALVGGLTVERRLELPRGAEVRGTVTAPDGRPVAGATVMARYGYHPRGRATTDEQGRYALLGVSPPPQPGPQRRGGPQNQVVVSPTAAWPTLIQGTAPLPDVAPGKTVTVDVQMAEGVAIAGRVTGPGGRPVAGCPVGAHQRRRGSLLGYARGATDADGRYLLPHLPPGDLFVSASPPASTGLLTVETPQRRYGVGKATVDIALKRGAAIAGRAVTSKGKPVVGAPVHLQRASRTHPQAVGQAVSGVGGAFRIEPVAPGTYGLTCMPADPTLRGKATAVTVAGTGEHKATVTVYEAGSVAGAIRDGKGQPIGHGFLWLTVTEVGAKGQPQRGTAHPKDGTWRVGGLVPGRYSVSVTLGRRGQQAGMTAPAPVEVTVAEGKETKLDVTAPFGAAKPGERTDF